MLNITYHVGRAHRFKHYSILVALPPNQESIILLFIGKSLHNFQMFQVAKYNELSWTCFWELQNKSKTTVLWYTHFLPFMFLTCTTNIMKFYVLCTSFCDFLNYEAFICKRIPTDQSMIRLPHKAMSLYSDYRTNLESCCLFDRTQIALEVIN